MSLGLLRTPTLPKPPLLKTQWGVFIIEEEKNVAAHGFGRRGRGSTIPPVSSIFLLKQSGQNRFSGKVARLIVDTNSPTLSMPPLPHRNG